MQEIKIYNTLNKKKEIFKPLEEGKIKMYSCGPTVYNYAHIGNLKAYVFADLMRRTFEYNNYEVKQIINITDIGHLVSDADDGEDKMVKALKREGKEFSMKAMKEIAKFYKEKFIEDLKDLNIKIPFAFPFASDYIKEYTNLIKKLEKKGFTYKISDGIYFDTSKYKNYGKLGGIQNCDDNMERRINENSEKKDHKDFALWKFNDEHGWDSPWGKGIPGWHIECSGIILKYLGKTIDIHTGGIDHIPIHHNNEIAQSENANDEKFVNYWMHSAFLNLKERMAKSKGNTIYLKDLKKENIDQLAYRYFLLQCHYQCPIRFSMEALKASQVALNKLRNIIFGFENEDGEINKEYKNKFIGFINDDLNIPQGLALVWTLLKDKKISDKDKKATILDFDKVLGLDLENYKKEEKDIPEEIQILIKKRQKERENKNWKEADKLRDEIKEKGFEIKD